MTHAVRFRLQSPQHGHASIQTTQGYAHTTEDRMRKVGSGFAVVGLYSPAA